MWAAIAQFWTFVSALSSAATNAATALEKCTMVADQAADTFLTDANSKHAIRKLELEARLAAAQEGNFNKPDENTAVS